MLKLIFCLCLVLFACSKKNNKTTLTNAISLINENTIITDASIKNLPVNPPTPEGVLEHRYATEIIPENIDAKEFTKNKLLQKQTISNIVGDLKYAYVLDSKANLIIIDTQKNKIKNKINLKVKEPQISASLVLNGSSLFALFRSGLILKIDLDTNIITARQNLGEIFTAPISLYSGVLYAQSIENTIYAISVLDLAVKWKTNTGTNETTFKSYASPIADGETIIAPSTGNEIILLSKQDGSVKTKIDMSDTSNTNSVFDIRGIYSQPILIQPNIIITNTQTELIFIASNTGQIIYKTDVKKINSITLIGGYILITTLENKVMLFSLESTTFKWLTDLKDGVLKKVENRHILKPLVIDGSAYIFSNVGEVFKINLSSGEVEKTFLVFDAITDIVEISQNPVIINNKIFVVTSKFIIFLS